MLSKPYANVFSYICIRIKVQIKIQIPHNASKSTNTPQNTYLVIRYKWVLRWIVYILFFLIPKKVVAGRTGICGSLIHAYSSAIVWSQSRSVARDRICRAEDSYFISFSFYQSTEQSITRYLHSTSLHASFVNNKQTSKWQIAINKHIRTIWKTFNRR